jgi:hypothetical protein
MGIFYMLLFKEEKKVMESIPEWMKGLLLLVGPLFAGIVVAIGSRIGGKPATRL